MGSLFKVDDLKKKTPWLFSVVMAPIYLISYLHHVAPNSHCRKYNLAQIFKQAQHPVDQNLLIISLCIWEQPVFETEGSLSSVISCLVSLPVFFLLSASHLENISLQWFWKDTARKQQALFSSTLVQTCQCCLGLLPIHTEESDPGSSDTYCKKVNG